jgi:NAD(P)-dependent dehydrogenase (short-subunit alcohol dehydrogenase family)
MLGLSRAAVENMMRPLAVEWARFVIKTCALAAGQSATETLLTEIGRRWQKSAGRSRARGSRAQRGSRTTIGISRPARAR